MPHRVILLDFVKPLSSSNEENYESKQKKRKFNPEEHQHYGLNYLHKLGLKLNERKPVPFSMDFSYVETKGENSPKEEMSAPLDVKISYKHEIIIVSDSLKGRLMVFDLNNGRFMSDCFPEKSPWQFVLEHDYDENGNEALICSTGNNYLKYDLLELIKSTKKKKAPVIWKTKFDRFSCFQCCVIKYSNIRVCVIPSFPF